MTVDAGAATSDSTRSEGRGLCESEDVANAVLFLASEEGGSTNATTLIVDGGATV